MTIQRYSVNQHPIQTLLTWIHSGEIYSMHCIPSDMESKTIDHYEDFLLERRKLMALKIRDYYQKL